MAMEMDLEFYLVDHKFALYDPAVFSNEKDISDEHFTLYHTIDRTLFYRLVCKLGRNPDESMFVVAFLIWLERICYSKNAVNKVISWPFHLVNQLANEIGGFIMWLKTMNISQEYSCPLNLLGNLCSREINSIYFHEKRIKILEGVGKIVSEVCKRAFRDILSSNWRFVDVEGDRMWNGYNINIPVTVPRPPLYHNVVGGFPQPALGETFRSSHFMGPSLPNNVAAVLENPDADLSELCGRMQLVDGCEDEPDVHPDDRTIFLTFSKGHYIPESVVREFFTRIFGDFIEGIYMNDVSRSKQPLFARMVCRSASIIPKICPTGIKIKYSIYGKKVSAKKYVKKGGMFTSE